MFKSRIKLFTRKVTEAFTACGLVMVQGDLSVFTLNHFIIAGRTGVLTGLAFMVWSFLKSDNRLMPVYLTGVFVAIADFVSHPSAIGHDLVEPLITGTCAMLIAYLYDRFKR